MSEAAPPRLRAAIFGLLALLTVASLAGTALSPYLLVKSPLLLVGISAAAHHVALAAASVDPVLLISVATLRRVLTAVGAYGLGYLYGEAAVAWLEQRYPRLARFVRFLERVLARWGVVLLVLAPAPTIALLAGAARTRLVYFLPAVALGHAAWNAATYYVGDALARRTELLLAFLEENLLLSTLACVALVALQQAYARLRRSRSKVAAPGQRLPKGT